MRRRCLADAYRRRIGVLALVAAALFTAGSGTPLASEPVTRTVYVTVTDEKGAPVAELTAADFAVKEGGKDREVAKAEVATTRMRLALLVEERLVRDGAVRTGLFEFAKRLQGAAEIALVVVGLRNDIVVDYTTSLEALVNGLNRLSLNPGPTSNLIEGIRDMSRALEQDRPARPVIVVVSLSGEQSGGAPPKEVLLRLQNSGAVMSAVTLTGLGASGAGSGEANAREQVLGDGVKQSGGRRVEATATSAVPKGLQQIAGDLLAQYVVSYTLPDGVKPDKRFSASLKRRGLSLRAPTTLPER